MPPRLRLAAGLLAACSAPPPTGPREAAPVPADTGSADTAPPEEVPAVSYDHLPVLLVDLAGQEPGSEAPVSGTLEVILDHDGTLTDLDAAPRDWSGPIGLELHGSSSLGYPKQGYRIELRDESGEDTEVPLLGMAPESDWVLHGPYGDKTLFRNALAYALGRELAAEAGRWEPDDRFAEVFLDGDYRGVYLVVERVKRDGHRLDLPVPAPSAADGDITGGYVVKIDQHRGEGWDTAAGTPIDYADPHADEITDEQAAWLAGWFDDFEALLASEDGADPVAGWPARVDADAFVDHFIVNELAHNVDAYRLSAYLWKDAEADGGRLHAGPLWDFDRAFGNVNYCDCWLTEGFVIDDLTTCGYGEQYPPWWSRLLADPDFTARLRCRWEALRGGALSDEALTERVLGFAEELAEAEPRDDARWGTIGTWVTPNSYVGETWEDEIDWLLAWLLARAAWLDGAMPGACEAGPPP